MKPGGRGALVLALALAGPAASFGQAASVPYAFAGSWTEGRQTRAVLKRGPVVVIVRQRGPLEGPYTVEDYGEWHVTLRDGASGQRWRLEPGAVRNAAGAPRPAVPPAEILVPITAPRLDDEPQG